MAGAKEKAMKEGSKLLIAILDGSQKVRIVPFSDNASAREFSLTTDADRADAIRYVDQLKIEGGTNYLAALKAADLKPGVPVFFLTDGEHSATPPEEVTAYLRQHRSGPLYAVAVEAPLQAGKLLTDMALLTKGSILPVSDSETLVRAFSEIATTLGEYRSFKPGQAVVRMPDAAGKVIALGYDVRALDIEHGGRGSALQQHSAELPGESVLLASVTLRQPTLLTIRATLAMDQPRSRLAAVLRNDLPQARLNIAPAGNLPLGSRIQVQTTFVDSDGKQIDPRSRRDVSSEFRLLDEQGRILATAKAKPSATAPALEGSFQLPTTAGVFRVANETTVQASGLPFRAESQRTIRVVQEGLALPLRQRLELGEALAGSGKKSASLRIPSRDTRARTYDVTALALVLPHSRNLIPVTADKTTVAPTKNTPDTLRLSVDVGDVRPGKYEGRLLITWSDEPGWTWEILLALTVIEPLKIAPLDFGKVAPGTTKTRHLRIGNTASAPISASLVAPPLTTQGGRITFRLSDKAADLGPGEEKEVPIRVVVSPLITSKGKLTGALTVRRGSQEIVVPVNLVITQEGEGGALLCTPKEVSLDGAKPGELQTFQLEIKLAAQGSEADEVTAAASFKDAQGRAADVIVALKDLRKGVKLTRDKGVLATVKIAAPEKPGVYTGAITLSSVHTGSVRVPITLTVK
jgi:hypothetical protein